MNATDWHERAEQTQCDPRPVIDGERRDCIDGLGFERLNPATGKAGLTIQAGGSEDVDRAVTSARNAFDNGWRSLSPMGRKHLLLSLANLIREHREELALLDSVEVGKPISAALGDADIAPFFIQYYAEAIDKYYGRTAPSCSNSLEIQVRQPRGVVAAITPWNFPVINAALKLGPALACGNTVVLKPSEYSIFSALRLAELAIEAGFPPGVINVVPGGGETGEALVTHPGVDMVTFTGSTRTGQRILETGARTRLRASALECGGKCPQLVFADAFRSNPEGLAMAMAQGALWNQGQVCVSRSRVLIESSVYNDVRDALLKACSVMVPAPPLDAQTQFGPLANTLQFEKTLGYLEVGAKEGAELILDGRGAGPERGYYVGPCVFDGVTETMAISQEEIFGPVITLQRFDADQQAVDMANGTPFGLAATVWTTDLARGHKVADAINAGTVHVNAAPGQVEGAMVAHSAEPYGQSGFGAEGGLNGMDTYTWLKATQFAFP